MESLTQRLLVYNAQNECCAICKQPITYEKIQTDHNHSTGVFRGLLCSKCNPGIGLFADDPQRLANAISYLESAPQKRGELPISTKLLSQPIPSIFREAKKPCKQCGSTQRYKSNRNCVPCYIEKNRLARKIHQFI